MAKTNVFFLRGLIRENAHSQFFFDEVKKTYPEISFHGLEIKGNGKYFKEDSPLKIEEMVENIRKIYLSHNTTPGNKNYLLAISLGGMVASEWMNKYPKDFDKAILMNTSLKGHCPLWHRLKLGNIPKYLKYVFSTDAAKKEDILYSIIMADETKRDKLVPHWAGIREKRPVSLSNTLRQMFAAVRYTPPVKAPKTPIIIARGLGDKMVNPECSKMIAKNWGLPLIEHPTGGHDITNDKPEWVIDLINQHFIQSQKI